VNQPDEAVREWRTAIQRDPGEGRSYLSLAGEYERSGRPELALHTYLELTSAVPTASNYLIAAQRIGALSGQLPDQPSRPTAKIAVLGNATLSHLCSYLSVECSRSGLRPILYEGGFDQYVQEISSCASRLYEFLPDVVILAIHASRLFPRIHDFPFELTVDERRAEMRAGLATLQSLLDRLTERSPALVLCHNMVAPQHPALGLLDWRDELGQMETFNLINAELARLVRNRYRNVYVLDEDRVQARVGKAGATDERLWFTARIPWSHQATVALAREHMRFIQPYRALGRKCIVLDLDGTLWGGIVGEDGVDGIDLGPESPGNAFVAFQLELRRFWQRGVILAVCSKNNEEDVAAAFGHPAMELNRSHFAAWRVNWEPKPSNLREIAEELNVGLDSIVFVDDNPVERAEMRSILPEVLTVELSSDPALFRRTLLELGVFETLAWTDEDRRRNQLYAAQEARHRFQSARASGGGSLEDYLSDLQIEIDIESANARNLPRIAQLTQKTNQFNLTTRRYSEAQIQDMQRDGWDVYIARVRDRFGDNGLTAVVIAEPTSAVIWELDTLLLSCRVMGRGVETVLLTFAADRVRGRGVKWLDGRFIPTQKNAPARDFYSRHDFHRLDRDADGSELWRLDLASASLAYPAWLTVHHADCQTSE
jgi:FkbH-like protein